MATRCPDMPSLTCFTFCAASQPAVGPAYSRPDARCRTGLNRCEPAAFASAKRALLGAAGHILAGREKGQTGQPSRPNSRLRRGVPLRGVKRRESVQGPGYGKHRLEALRDGSTNG